MTTQLPHSHDEREWQAQERALRELRAGIAPTQDDPAIAQYRRVAEVLAQPPASVLPVNFSAHVAAQARASAQRVTVVALDGRMERALIRALMAILLLSGAMALLYYGATLVPWLQVQIGSAGIGWTGSLAACVAMSWALDRLRQVRSDSEMRAA